MKYQSSSTHQSKDIVNVNVFNKLVKHQGQKVKILVPMEKFCHKKYSCEIWNS
jgi:hypothetical protein